MIHSHGEQIVSAESWMSGSVLESQNPGIKMILALSSLWICIISKSVVTPVAIGLAMVFITLYFGKMDGRTYARFLCIPVSFLLLSGMVLLVDITRQRYGFLDIPVGAFYLSVTKDSIAETGLVMAKALAGITCLFMLSFSTPVNEIAGVLKRLRVPPLVIELVYFIYRFLHILLETYSHMHIAADSRLGYRSVSGAYASFTSICTNLLVLAFFRASKSFDAMESRCYDGAVQFLEREKPVTGGQVALLAVYLVAAAAMLVLERIWI